MSKYLHSDCLEILKGLPTKSYELAIVDPPYGLKEDGRRTPNTQVKQRNGKTLTIKCNPSRERWDDVPPSQDYFDELFRVSKHQIIWGCNNFEFNQKSESSGRLVWDKVTTNNSFSDCELAWTSLWKGLRLVTYMWNGMMQGKSLAEPRTPQGNKSLNEKRLQRAQKPIILYRWILNQPEVIQGWKILDTHVGSASSLIACEMEGFEYLGMEKNETHYQNSSNRLAEYLQLNSLLLFPKAKGVLP